MTTETTTQVNQTAAPTITQRTVTATPLPTATIKITSTLTPTQMNTPTPTIKITVKKKNKTIQQRKLQKESFWTTFAHFFHIS